MPAKNIFSEPFDDGTKVKLEIFKKYLKEWLPVFVAQKNPTWKNVQIFDFFSGEGKDKNGIPGSPLIILDIVKDFMPLIKAHGINIKIIFNDPNCYDKLKINVEEVGQLDHCSIEVRSEKFQSLFHEFYDSMNHSANFIFFDQNGIKEITQDVFQKVIRLKKTDFLFFISSSYFKRFSETAEFKNYFSFPIEEIRNLHYYHIHRKVLKHYKTFIPHNQKYFLAPFSIKKGPNIYGLIFGTNHTFGIEKFLSVAWKIDSQRGEANYDIDGEKITPKGPFLFDALNIPSKRKIFENNVESKILNGELRTQLDAYLFSLQEGFLLKDVNTIFKKLQKEGKINDKFKMISARLHKEIEAIPLLKQI